MLYNDGPMGLVMNESWSIINYNNGPMGLVMNESCISHGVYSNHVVVLCALGY